MLIVAGLAVAFLAVLLVLEPVLRAASGRPARTSVPLFADSDDEDDPLLRRRDRALAALREIEFDRATGKLSDDDYRRLLAKYQAEALEALRAADSAAPRPTALPPYRPTASADDAIERLIAEARGRAAAGKRRYCIECGAALEGSGRFCVECGASTAPRAPAGAAR